LLLSQSTEPIFEVSTAKPHYERSQPCVRGYQGRDSYHGRDSSSIPPCQGYKDENRSRSRRAPDSVKPDFGVRW